MEVNHCNIKAFYQHSNHLRISEGFDVYMGGAGYLATVGLADLLSAIESVIVDPSFPLMSMAERSCLSHLMGLLNKKLAAKDDSCDMVADVSQCSFLHTDKNGTALEVDLLMAVGIIGCELEVNYNVPDTREYAICVDGRPFGEWAAAAHDGPAFTDRPALELRRNIGSEDCPMWDTVELFTNDPLAISEYSKFTAGLAVLGRRTSSVGLHSGQMKEVVVEHRNRSIDDIAQKGLPGFYMSNHGCYGIVMGSVYICAFINSDTNEYDVTVDTVDNVGDFADNVEWESFNIPEAAIDCLRRMVQSYCPSISQHTSR